MRSADVFCGLRRALSGVGLATLVMLPIGPGAEAADRHGAPTPALRYAPAVGQERILRVSMKGTATFDLDRLAAAMAPQPSGSPAARGQTTEVFELTATLHSRVVGSSGGSARFVVDGQPQGRTVLLATPFLLTYSPRGGITQVEFPRGFPRDEARTLTGLVEALDVELGASPGAEEWTVDERGTEGKTKVRYRIQRGAAGPDVVRLSRQTIAADHGPLLAGLDAPGVMARFLGAVNETPSEVVPLLKYYLRQHPEDVRKVAQVLDQQDRSTRGRGAWCAREHA